MIVGIGGEPEVGVTFFGRGIPPLNEDELWEYISSSAHGWQTWLDGYGAGFAAAQGALIDRVLRAEADADRYYMLAFNPRETAKVLESYVQRCIRRGEPERARRAQERIDRLFPTGRFQLTGAR
ncbi:hypothetical protein [Agromyces aureus]|uniref:Uncharacterized protein n=1 Tax=Agromyces aureus TaxID=453304 RepID=A0A191WBT6_9MICO|nr:hypothetical protein [Agromyces aureus]ANJ25721.1 hypothetical protein ATC03_02025 [Agromyces aureus]